jgi:phage tail sheath protein FI
MFAFLGLPRSYDASTCVLYQSLLTTALTPENGPRTLSYAAIYHPWVVVLDSADDQPGSIRSVSPEGAMTGITAARTLATGAWLSPGNQLLQAVVDLDVQLGDEAQLTFFTNRLNLVMQEATGFLTLSSLTLSSLTQLTEINVRRLLILLRRLALREGMVYVFQPNDNAFWRRVQRRFEDVLGSLYLQGAFAGDTQSEAFQVTADSSVNTPVTVSSGQFIVEIAIAPSLPLEFLTVRLLQEGGDLTLSEES